MEGKDGAVKKRTLNVPVMLGLAGLVVAGLVSAHKARTVSAGDLQSIREGVASINATLPQMVRDDLRVDRVAFDGAEVQYFATYVASTVDDIDLEAAPIETGKYFGTLDCGAPEVRQALADGMRFHYFVVDMNNTPVVDFVVTSANCR